MAIHNKTYPTAASFLHLFILLLTPRREVCMPYHARYVDVLWPRELTSHVQRGGALIAAEVIGDLGHVGTDPGAGALGPFRARWHRGSRHYLSAMTPASLWWRSSV